MDSDQPVSNRCRICGRRIQVGTIGPVCAERIGIKKPSSQVINKISFKITFDAVDNDSQADLFEGLDNG